MIPSISRFHFFSTGIVAVDKKPSTKEIEVFPMETSPMSDGEVTDNVETLTAKGQNASGESFQDEVKATATILATWLPFGDTNRMTAPDVRRGEYVAIYRFGDADEYYWVTLLQDNKLRRLETVIYAFSNMRDENKPFDADSSYWFEVSTMAKHITIHTAKNDGEPFAYDIQLNTKDGCFTIKDDDGQVFYVDSQERQLRMQNRDGSWIEINKGDFNGFTPKSVNWETQTYTIKTTKMTVNADSFEQISSSWKTSVPNAEFSSDVSNGGDTNTGGSTNIGGNLGVGGGGNFGGHVSASNID